MRLSPGRLGHAWLLATALLLTTPGAAQVFIVDANNGPGTNFTTIAAATTAVPDGAVLDVRPGTYDIFQINAKGLTLRGQPGARVFASIFPFITVSGLSASQSVTISGLDISGSLGAAQLNISNNQGDVILQQLTSAFVLMGVVINAQQTSRLYIVNCDLSCFSPSGLTLDASQAFVTGSTFRFNSPSYVGVSLSGTSSIDMMDSQLFTSGVFGLAAMSLTDPASSARVRGNSRIDNTPGQTFSTTVIGNGTLRIAPTAQIVSSSVPAVSPTVSMTVVAMPGLTVSVPSLGSAATATWTMPPGAVGGMWAGVPTMPVVVPPFAEPVSIDPQGASAVVTGSVSPVTWTYLVPSLPALLNTRIAWQGWSFSAVTGFQASNAVVTTVL